MYCEFVEIFAFYSLSNQMKWVKNQPGGWEKVQHNIDEKNNSNLKLPSVIRKIWNDQSLFKRNLME